MHVYSEIAESFGVDPGDSEAVLRFFSEDIYDLSIEVKKSIAMELLSRDAEQAKEEGTTEDSDEFIPLPDPSNYIRADVKRRMRRLKKVNYHE